MDSGRRGTKVYNSLLLILLLAISLRFTGHNWDQGTLLHPDERYLVDLMTKIRFDIGITGEEIEKVSQRSQECVDQYQITGETAFDCTFLNFTVNHKQELPISIDQQTAFCLQNYPEKAGAGSYLDTRCSPLNPHNAGSTNFAYGTLPLLLTRASAEIYDSILNLLGVKDTYRSTGIYLWHAEIADAGRFVSSFLDVLGIVFVFLIGHQIHSKHAGIIAAAFYAFSPLSIQLSHFATVNAAANFFCILALWFVHRVFREGKWLDYIGFGFATACALASRINLAPILGLAVIAFVYRIYISLRNVKQEDSEEPKSLVKETAGFLLCGLATLFFFRIFNPYAFTGPNLLSGLNERWILDIQNSISTANGYFDWPPNWQWGGRLSYIYPLKDIIFWGFGLSASIPAILGLFYFSYQWIRGVTKSSKYLLLLAWVIGYFGWIGGAWVMTMRYYLPLYGALSIISACFLCEVYNWYQKSHQGYNRKRFRILPRSLLFLLPLLSFTWSLMFHNIYRQPLTRVQGSSWIQYNIPSDVTIRLVEEHRDSPLINISLDNYPSLDLPGDELLLQRSSILYENTFVEKAFQIPKGGRIKELYFPHLGRRFSGSENIRLIIELLDDTANLLAQFQISDSFPTSSHPLGDAFQIPIADEIELLSGQTYWMRFLAQGGDLYIGGSVVSDEGVWDDRLSAVRSCEPVLLKLHDQCTYKEPYVDQVLQYNMNMSAEDDQSKLNNLLHGLARSDYITISSNRFYDSQARNPLRFPLSNHFYHQLFSGELGFDLVAQFVEGYQIGNLRVLDQRLPIHSHPTWLNQFEADEAFHVYDHPAVFIYKKRADFDLFQAEASLRKISLTSVYSSPIYGNCPFLDQNNQLAIQCTATVANHYSLSSREVDQVPSQLMYSNEQLELQTTKSSWFDQFDLNSTVNSNQFVSVVVWLSVILMIGFVSWIPVYLLFPVLSDRGYGLAKTAGLVFFSWVAWLLTSIQFPVWNQSGLWLLVLVSTATGISLIWPKRESFIHFLREKWKQILFIEFLFTTLFLICLLIRLSNPDLWHNVFGGEKMMDSAYFNGVLRSEIFPPINPWYSGSYINYYYFGFVFVGLPTLMSGIIPSIAYNLIIPTIFAIAGISTFSIVYSIAERVENPRIRPKIAGIASLTFLLLLGNLDTFRLWLNAVNELGITELSNHASNFVESTLAGIFAWFRGTNLPISGSEWMWNPTRVISHSIQDHSITEFPFFTFLYGDLHAHMLALPILSLALAFLVHELMIVGKDDRSSKQRVILLMVWAGVTGVTWATNSWDWVPFTLLGVCTVSFTWWQRKRQQYRINLRQNRLDVLQLISEYRSDIIELFLYLFAFLLTNFLATAPFRSWFATTAADFEIWRGPYTPIWAYLSIHGHFILLITCWLLWLSVRQFGMNKRAFLTKNAFPVSVSVFILLFGLILGVLGRSILLIVVPLIVWAAFLLHTEKTNSNRVILLLILVSLGLSMIPELIRIRQDIGRQNTVFKLYFMSWQFFSLFGGLAFAILWNIRNRWGKFLRISWYVSISTLFSIIISYPILATNARSEFRFETATPLSLDGLEFMRYAKYWESNELFPLEPDYQIIQWLLENVSGSPVIMEGRTYGSEYRWNGRIASFTGLPSVIGWQFHQQQQRTFPPMSDLIQRRAANVTAFFTTSDIEDAIKILNTYEVKYIILGPLEHALYNRADESDPAQFVNGYTKFDALIDLGFLEVVFEFPYQYQSDNDHYHAVARILKVVST